VRSLRSVKPVPTQHPISEETWKLIGDLVGAGEDRGTLILSEGLRYLAIEMDAFAMNDDVPDPADLLFVLARRVHGFSKLAEIVCQRLTVLGDALAIRSVRWLRR